MELTRVDGIENRRCGMNLGDVFRRNARCFGSHPAVYFEGETVSHAQLMTRIERVLSAFAGLGCQRQDRIAVLSRNCVEYLEIYGAAAIGGLIGVGLNYRLSEPEQLDILRDAEPAVLVFEDIYTERVAGLRAGLPPQTKYVCIGPAAPPWAIGYEALCAGAASATSASGHGLQARDDDTLFIIYTSGTTGQPKGVMLSNAGQLEQSRAQAISHAAQQTDRMLIVMPFYHIGGPTELLTYLVVGASIVLHRSFDAGDILRSIETMRVSSAHLAPTMIQMLLEVMEQKSKGYDVSSLHTIVYASAPMSVALSRRARAVFGPIFMQIYGMTELGLGSVLLKHQHVLEGAPEAVKRLASAGQPYLGTDMRIVAADGSDCVSGQIGDVWMRSPALMQGYWRRPEASAAALADGWLRTGDMGYWDDEGFLFIVDRKKDMIVSGGENIYSREVEEALLLHPAVAEAAVIGVPDQRWGESVMAFVVLRPGSTLTEEEAVTHCRALIASYKKPRYLRVLDAMPRVPSTNKIDKKALRAPFWQAEDRQVA